MRTRLISALVILAQWGLPAYGQRQAGAMPSSGPAATNGYVRAVPAKRLFFFMRDPKDTGQPAARGPRSNPITRPVPPASGYSALRFPPTGLIPVESAPPRDLWRFLKPENSRLFFFSKP